MNHLLTQPEYLTVIADMGKQAVAMADTESFVQDRLVKDIRSYYIQCNNADCTFNAYKAASYAEGVFEQLKQYIATGKI